MLAQMLDETAARMPKNAAAECHGQVMTYSDLKDHTDKMAGGMARLGVAKGERVMLALPNVPQFIVSYYGILKTGAQVVPVSTMCKSPEFEQILKDCRPKMVITSSITAPELRRAVQSSGCSPVLMCIDSAEAGDEDWHSLLSNGGEKLTPVYAEPDDIAAVLYTSGATGRSKGVQLTHSNLFTNARACAQVAGVLPSDKYICVLPLFHAFGQTCIMNASVAAGASVVLRAQFNPRELAGDIAAGETTGLAAVPSILAVLLKCFHAMGLKQLPLRFIVSGGAPLPAEILRHYRNLFGLKICEGYGLTESSPVISMNRYDSSHRPGSVGRPLPEVQVRILGERGRDLPAGEEGEILVRGPGVMKGYLNLPKETESAVKDGWLFTGDLGYLDEEGYLFVSGRKKDLIIYNGLNVHPAEVENVICQIDGVTEAAVLGIKDDRHGQCVTAFVCSPKPLKEEDIISCCRQNLASYKVPRRIVFLDSLPRNSVGKVLRKALHDKLKK